MRDRETVTQELRDILSPTSRCFNIQTIMDAINLLEAQKPRLMTLEELEDWDGAVFFEVLATDMYYVLIETVEPSAGMKGSYVFINVEHGEHYRRVWDGEHYGSIWRCWTSRPTVEQRKAVKWEDEKHQ